MKKQGLFLALVIFVLLVTACGAQTEASLEQGVDISAPVDDSQDTGTGDAVDLSVNGDNVDSVERNKQAEPSEALMKSTNVIDNGNDNDANDNGNDNDANDNGNDNDANDNGDDDDANDNGDDDDANDNGDDDDANDNGDDDDANDNGDDDDANDNGDDDNDNGGSNS